MYRADISSALKKQNDAKRWKKWFLLVRCTATVILFSWNFLFWVSMWAIVIVNWRVQRDIWQSLTKKLKESKKFWCSSLLLQHPIVLTVPQI